MDNLLWHCVHVGDGAAPAQVLLVPFSKSGGTSAYSLPKYDTLYMYILLRRRGHATPIVTVQTFFSITKNSNIAQVRSAHANTAYKNSDGCTSCMPS